MKKNLLRLLFALMTVMVFFTACNNDSNDSSSVVASGGGAGDSTPKEAPKDPDIPDGKYIYKKNTIVTLKKDADFEMIEYPGYEEYLKDKNGNAAAGDKTTWSKAYEVVWYGSIPARKIKASDVTYYVYLEGSKVRIVKKTSTTTDTGFSATSFGIDLSLLSSYEKSWAVPENEAVYVSEKKYDGTNYLYAVYSETSKKVTFSSSAEQNSSLPAGAAKLGELNVSHWSFGPGKNIVGTDDKTWTVNVSKNEGVVTLSISKTGDNNISSVVCKKKV